MIKRVLKSIVIVNLRIKYLEKIIFQNTVLGIHTMIDMYINFKISVTFYCIGITLGIYKQIMFNIRLGMYKIILNDINTLLPKQM